MQDKKINNINKKIGNAFKNERLTPEEYKKECIEGNISKENLVFNDEEKRKLNNVENGEDNNLKFVGNEEDYLKDILYKIKNINDYFNKKYVCFKYYNNKKHIN